MRAESVSYCKGCIYYHDAHNKLMAWAKCNYKGFEQVIDTKQLATCKLLNYRKELSTDQNGNFTVNMNTNGTFSIG